jgi:hypothetical protein
MLQSGQLRKEILVSKLVALMLMSAALVGVLAGACDDGDDASATPVATSTAPAVATGTVHGAASPAASMTVEATPRANPSVEGAVTGGSATASVTVAGETHAYSGGGCAIGADDEYVRVNIGTVGGGEYFSVLAGRSPAADADTRSTKGGGEFSGDDVLVTFAAEGRSFLLRSADTKLTLAPDLRSGTFTSVEANAGTAVRGEFSCGP